MGMSYFHFSKEQLDSRVATDKKLGKTFIPGKIIVKGKEKMYTEKTDSPDFKYADHKIVYQADLELEKVSFTEPYSD